MLNNLLRVYFLGAVFYATRHVWQPHYRMELLGHDALVGLVYAAVLPGMGVAALLPSVPFPYTVCGGSLVFWLALYGISKAKRLPASGPAVPMRLPQATGYTRQRTYYEEEEI